MHNVNFQIKKEFFNLIASGQKTNEIRLLSESNVNKLFKIHDLLDNDQKCIARFQNGYAKNAPVLYCEITDYEMVSDVKTGTRTPDFQKRIDDIGKTNIALFDPQLDYVIYNIKYIPSL